MSLRVIFDRFRVVLAMSAIPLEASIGTAEIMMPASFDSEVSKRGCPPNDANFGIGTLACTHFWGKRVPSSHPPLYSPCIAAREIVLARQRPGYPNGFDHDSFTPVMAGLVQAIHVFDWVGL